MQTLRIRNVQGPKTVKCVLSKKCKNMVMRGGFSFGVGVLIKEMLKIPTILSKNTALIT